MSKNFIAGLVTILPVALTLYLLYWLAVTAESALGGVIRSMLPDGWYWPGMGLITSLVAVFLVGLLMHAYVVQRLFAKGEQLLYHMPIIKSVYRSIHDFFHYFSPTKEKEFEQVVAVKVANSDMQVIGYQAIPEHMPKDLREEDSILVYMPLSYMIGGYTVLIPRKAVRPLNMTMEEAMRFTLTAGVTGNAKQFPGG